MEKIRDILSRDLNQKIEEIIKVDQADEQAVYSEITEYIATDSIRSQYAALLKAIAEAPSDPHESIGVWISGFFGSGKSSFAKNLGYALQNRKIRGTDFSALFKKQIGDEHVSNLIDLINARYPMEVIMFDIAKEQDTRRHTQRIAEFIYALVLRHLDYAEDFDIAELEIELEAEGKLEQFIAKCKEIHGKDWHIIRKGAQRISRASAVLHALDPITYPSADSWAKTQREHDTTITVAKVVQRTFELFHRRRPGKAIVFIIDEVGQHVARSVDKIEDLRATVEEFGRVGRNLLKARKITAPCWIIVTSQEKLDEVVAAIDSRRVELAKLQDRFAHRIDLAPSDIREVATKRVLAKKAEAIPLLRELYNNNQGALNAALRLERTSRRTDVSLDDFIQFYPYPPHYIDICISIMSGIRLQPGAPKHLGGSNRTIIKQAYEMLVSERTRLADHPIGTLVTLDRVYELVEGNLSNERRTDIYEISQRFKGDPDEQWIIRVSKVVCLLEFVRDLPRTEANIAAFLVDKVGDSPPVQQVKEALKKLNEAQFIRNTEEGWKLQTALEKNWETEKKSFDPRPRDRNDIVRDAIKKIFSDPLLRTYRHRTYRTFKIGVSLDGTSIDDGDIKLNLFKAEDHDELPRRIDEARDESRQKTHENDIYWVFNLTPEIDQLVAQLFASKKMVEKYDQLRVQNKITSDEATCLQDEKNLVLNYEARLQDKVIESLERGTGMFRGVARDASSLGKNLSEIIKQFLDQVVPDIYPKLEMGSRQLSGDEPDIFLKSADLKALPQVFYDGENGLALVVKEGSKYVPNPKADVAKEVLDYLISQYEYGNREACNGKALETRFNGAPYGWERDMLRLVLAALFRAGVIEVSFGGQKFNSFTDPRSREPFTNNTKFKSAVFTPVKPIDLKTLTKAVSTYEELTGKTVDVEKNAIAMAAKEYAESEIKEIVIPALEKAKAWKLPVVPILEKYQEILRDIQNGSADDCVNVLASGAISLKDTRERVRKVATCLNNDGLAIIEQARLAADEMTRQLEAHGEVDIANEGKHLGELLQSENLIENMSEIEATAQRIAAAYRKLYNDIHADRAKQFQDAIERVKSSREWEQVPELMREQVLSPLTSRACQDIDLPELSLTCNSCHASISQMESDIEALGGIFAKVVSKIQELITPKEVKIKRVKISDFLSGSFESADQITEAVARLQDYLLKLLDEGVKIVVE